NAEETRGNVEELGAEDEGGVTQPGNDQGLNFWTACPYCYYMYEYPVVYVDCTLKCQNCKRAFHGVSIPEPPPTVGGGQGAFFCCWGFLPLGFSTENWKKSKGAASSWAPFSPMFSCPPGWNGCNAPKQQARNKKKSSAPRVYIDEEEDEVFVELSESSESEDDDDWGRNTDNSKKKKSGNVKRKGVTGSTTPTRSAKKSQADKAAKDVDGVTSSNGVETPNKTGGESSKKGPVANPRKQPGRVAKNFGKLDLNVEFSNETEETAPKVDEAAPGPSRGEDDNIEGIAFFDGLDEFLSSLPILNVVPD
ncbi:hypothetical protein M569_08915, partial [Genlisea aurea]